MNAQFYANMAIDAIQNSKTQFLNSFVKESSFREPMQSFVDAQTSFAKEVVKTTQSLWSAAKDLDYSKAFKMSK